MALNLDALDEIAQRVGKGVATAQDVQDLLAEVQRLYGYPGPLIALQSAVQLEAGQRAAAIIKAAEDDAHVQVEASRPVPVIVPGPAPVVVPQPSNQASSIIDAHNAAAESLAAKLQVIK